MCSSTYRKLPCKLRQIDKFLIIYAKSHKRISKDTVFHWINAARKESAIVTQCLHCILVAQLPHPKLRVSSTPLKNISDDGGWSNKKSFTIHNYKEIIGE